LTLGFALKGYDRQGGMLTLDMDANYLKLDTTTEVLVRAALVRTLTQVTGIYYVKITVEGEPLLDVLGEEIGWMRANDFVYNDGNEINTYEPVRISLFFATKEGNRLKWTSRTKYYSTNTPLEKLIVEELIAGPLEGERDYYACIHPNTRITSIQTQDGTCYVNLSEEFLSVVGNVPTAVAKESITRSLLELNDIHRVHVMVNGRLVE
jgi:germination protein M